MRYIEVFNTNNVLSDRIGSGYRRVLVTRQWKKRKNLGEWVELLYIPTLVRAKLRLTDLRIIQTGEVSKTITPQMLSKRILNRVALLEPHGYTRAWVSIHRTVNTLSAAGPDWTACA